MTMGCDVWAVTTTLDVESFTTASRLATADVVTSSDDHACTWEVDLAANTAYALVLDVTDDTDTMAAGTVGPLSMTTHVGTATTDRVVMD